MTTLSDLPEDVVDYIFSCASLTSKDVIRNSLVSKQFLSRLDNHPALVFDGSASHPEEQLNHMISILDRYQKHNIPLQNFTFMVDSANDLMSNEWVKCIKIAATQRDLRFLSLSMPPLAKKFTTYFVFSLVFKVDSLVELTLRNCHVQPPERISCRNLRRLALDTVHIAEGMFLNIMRSCPLIEKLLISRCFGDYTLEYLSSSTKFDKPKYENLKDLTTLPFVNDIITNTSDLTLNFPGLEKLEFLNAGFNKRTNISSLSLRHIDYHFKDRGVGLHLTHFDAPNVVDFTFSWIWSGAGNFPELTFAGNSSGWISRIRLLFMKKVRSSWLLRLKTFLKSFSAALNSSEIASLAIFLDDTIIVPKADHEMRVFPREIIPGIPECRIESRGVKFCSSSVRAVFDGFFLIYRPKKIIFRHLIRAELESESAPKYEHDVKFPTSDEFMEVLRDHDKEDMFTVVFNLEY